MKRRDFLRVLGLVSGSALFPSCGSRGKRGKLVSYLLPPDEEVVPGEAVFFPSTCTECPAGCGILVRVREGRPVKLEGLPGHPVSDGGLCIRGQSSLQRLYHPERLRRPLIREGDKRGAITWEEAFSRIAQSVAQARKEGRRSLFLSGRTTGSLSRLADDFCRRTGVERLPEFEVYGHDAVRQANGLLFGQRDVPRYRIDRADFLLTVGADILETYVSPVGYARMISRARGGEDFAWHHAEPHFSLTGANADARLVVAPGREADLLLFLLRETVDRRKSTAPLPRELRSALPRATVAETSAATGIAAPALRETADRLVAARSPLVILGGVSGSNEGSVRAAAAAALIQWATGAVPALVDLRGSENYGSVGTFRDMEAVAARMGRGEAGVVFLFRTNPVFSLPRRMAFGPNLGKAALSVALCDFLDETAREADIVLPLSHSLESWGDAEPRKGLVSLIRPAIAPLHDTLSDGDVLLGLTRAAGKAPATGYAEFLEDRWGRQLGEAGRKGLLEAGYLERTPPGKAVTLDGRKAVTLDGRKAATLLANPGPAAGAAKPLLVLVPSIRTFDGRSRPLTLLSEIPDPLTTITYGPWVSVSPETAARQGLADGDEVSLASGDWSAAMPVKVQAGLPEEILVVHRDALDAPPVRTEPAAGGPVDCLGGVRIIRTGKRIALPILSGSFSQQGRGIVPDSGHLEEKHRHDRISLYPELAHRDYRWGMAVDLDRCTGCAACVAACYVENNVPVVGKADHLRGREMSWLRVEPYYEANGKVAFLPMLCQHCEAAPCESVCPVFAAYHNPEGLNVQVYARCVGTRYCSNNCPYKVRRFNWWEHHRPRRLDKAANPDAPGWPEPLDLMLNPDVYVRGVGVMEKCTFCIQRIRAAKDRAKDEGRKVRDGEFTTACAQSCPAGALVFGDLLDPESRVSRLARSDRAYRVFETLGTGPAVHYLGGKRRGKGSRSHG